VGRSLDGHEAKALGCAVGGGEPHAAEVTAAEVVLEGEVQGAALRLVGKVVREGVQAEEADERVELVDAVLQRRAGEAPAVARCQRKRGLRCVAAAVLDAMRLVEHDAAPPDLQSTAAPLSQHACVPLACYTQR